MDNYKASNLANWEERAAAHAASPDYQVHRFIDDPDFISEVVRFDSPLLGQVSGLRGVHLQCHIGTDTISLSRLGASMVGLDFSPAALAQARLLAERTGCDTAFVQADTYEASSVLDSGSFDLVYTGVGALCWLPDIRQWAETVADLLRPGGRLFIREGHPMLWSMSDTRGDSELTVENSYFERDEPTIRENAGSYVETDAVFQHNKTFCWNHGLGEMVTALMDAGMTLTCLVEHDSVPWNALPGALKRIGGGEWRLADRPWRLPHSYTLQAAKRL